MSRTQNIGISAIDKKIGHMKSKEEFNVLAMPSRYCKSGKYNIKQSDYLDFLRYISEDVVKEIPIHYLERPHPEYNQVKIDLDLRYSASKEEISSGIVSDKKYNIEFINDFIAILDRHINEIISEQSYSIYVQEKQNSKITNDKKVKEGIHIIIPSLVMHNSALHMLRNKVIDDPKTKMIFDRIKNVTPLEDVIDKCIIDKNSWFLYGNGKNNDVINGTPDFYETTYIYKHSDGVLKKLKDKKVSDLHSDYYRAIKLFSNYGKTVNVKYKTNNINNKIQSAITTGTNNINVPMNASTLGIAPSNKKRTNTSLTKTEIEGLLACINKERADNYDYWWRVGLALYNMDNRNYGIWDTWSQNSSKYDEDASKKMWASYEKISTKYGLGLHTLKLYAEEDNPTKYAKFTQLEKKKYLETWLINIMNKEDYMEGRGFDLVNFVNHVIKYVNDYADFNTVCADPEGKQLWYKFCDHRWIEDKGACSLILMLRNTLMTDFKTLKAKLKNDITTDSRMMQMVTDFGDDDNDTQLSSQDQITNFKNMQSNINTKADQIKIINKILNYLQNITNRKKIVEDMSFQTYDNKFFEKLDINPYVFVCNNGVLDLHTLEFRKGDMEDMVTIYSDITFPSDTDDFEAIDIISEIEDFISKIFVDEEIRTYMMNIIAEKLCGHNNREEFFIVTGSGSNGKSQFFHLVSAAFGGYYAPFNNTLLNTEEKDANSASPAKAALRGPRIASTSEPKANKSIEPDLLKMFIGGEPLVGRFLNKNNITFKPQYLMFMMCNDIPEMPATDDGIWRKVRVIPCESKFVVKQEDMYKLNEPDKYPNHFKGSNDLNEALYKRWAPYFIKMLFDIYKNLHAKGFRFRIPDKVLEATKQYKASANMFETYFKDRIKLKPGYATHEGDAFMDFKNYVVQNGLGHPVSKKNFVIQIERFIGKLSDNKKFIGYTFGEAGEPINN